MHQRTIGWIRFEYHSHYHRLSSVYHDCHRFGEDTPKPNIEASSLFPFIDWAPILPIRHYAVGLLLRLGPGSHL